MPTRCQVIDADQTIEVYLVGFDLPTIRVESSIDSSTLLELVGVSIPIIKVGSSIDGPTLLNLTGFDLPALSGRRKD